ncbi:MAG: hypothetical protein QXF78_03380, partial [Pyrobaculum sp.]
FNGLKEIRLPALLLLGGRRIIKKEVVELFKTAATLTLIGGLTAVVLVGYIILFIAFILATIAAFSLKPQQAGALEF